MRIDTGRAQRRHDNARLKAVRSKHLLVAGRGPTAEQPTERRVGLHLNTAARCSCASCGNPRKYRGELSLQELRLSQRFRVR